MIKLNLKVFQVQFQYLTKSKLQKCLKKITNRLIKKFSQFKLYL